MSQRPREDGWKEGNSKQGKKDSTERANTIKV